MRIYYLANARVPAQTANSNQIMHMCQAFAKTGNSVVLFAKPGIKSEDPFEFYNVDNCFGIERGEFDVFSKDYIKFLIWQLQEILHTPKKIKYFLKWRNRHTWYISDKINKIGIPDLIYSRHSTILEAVASLGSIMMLESHYLPFKSSHIHAEKKLFLNPNFKRLVVISKALKDDYIKAFPYLDGRKIHVAHDGADLPLAIHKGNDSKLNGRVGHLQVGYIGSLYPGKGMEIISKLALSLHEVDFHVIGGNSKDINYWKGQASYTNLYYHGYITQALLPQYYQHLEIVLAPLQSCILVAKGKLDISRWTSPLKIFEYMAYKKPIIASDIPVLREILNDNVTALLVPPDDISAWGKAIACLQNNPDLRNKLAESGYSALANQYTWGMRAKQVLDISSM